MGTKGVSGPFGRRRSRRKRQQVEGAMRDLATAFLATCERAGHHLTITTTSARDLDAALATLIDERLTPAKLGGVVRGAAAFLGEVLVEERLGVWTLLPGSEQAVLAILPDGVPVLNLVTVVDRRIRATRPETLAAFLDRCLDGLVRPGTEVEAAPAPTTADGDV